MEFLVSIRQEWPRSSRAMDAHAPSYHSELRLDLSLQRGEAWERRRGRLARAPKLPAAEAPATALSAAASVVAVASGIEHARAELRRAARPKTWPVAGPAYCLGYSGPTLQPAQRSRQSSLDHSCAACPCSCSKTNAAETPWQSQTGTARNSQTIKEMIDSASFDFGND